VVLGRASDEVVRYANENHCELIIVGAHGRYYINDYVLGTISKILNVECDPQKSFEWLIGINNYPLFCDGVFEDCKLVVETDGKHHKIPMKQFGGYERFEIQKQNDKLKDYLVKEHGYTMIRIDIDSDWSNIDYLKLRLLENDIKVA